MQRKAAIDLPVWSKGSTKCPVHFRWRALSFDPKGRVRIEAVIGNTIFMMRGTYTMPEANKIMLDLHGKETE